RNSVMTGVLVAKALEEMEGVFMVVFDCEGGSQAIRSKSRGRCQNRRARAAPQRWRCPPSLELRSSSREGGRRKATQGCNELISGDFSGLNHSLPTSEFARLVRGEGFRRARHNLQALVQHALFHGGVVDGGDGRVRQLLLDRERQPLGR